MTAKQDPENAVGRDFFLAKWEEDQLTLEPFCSCGQTLDEDYFCPKCRRQCEISFFLCEDSATLSVVRRFIQGNPSFRNFEADLLKQ